MHRIGNRPGFGLPDLQSLVGIQFAHLALDVIQLYEEFQPRLGNLAGVVHMQLEQLAPGVCQQPTSTTPRVNSAL